MITIVTISLKMIHTKHRFNRIGGGHNRFHLPTADEDLTCKQSRMNLTKWASLTFA